MANEKYVYCHILWVDSVKHRLFCLDKMCGPIRGLTKNEYEYLKPKVEALKLDDFKMIPKMWPTMKGLTKEEIEKDILYIKDWFKEFETHPERLGKDLQDITYRLMPTAGMLTYNNDHRYEDVFIAEGYLNPWGKSWDWTEGYVAPKDIRDQLFFQVEPYPQPANGELVLSKKSREEFGRKMAKEMPKIKKLLSSEGLSETLKRFIPSPPTSEEQEAWKRKVQTYPGFKKMKIDVELSYPDCDTYDAKDSFEFVSENIQDWLNANLSDGDNRLRISRLSVTCDKQTIKTH